jgi:chromosome segregation ATPase
VETFKGRPLDRQRDVKEVMGLVQQAVEAIRACERRLEEVEASKRSIHEAASREIDNLRRRCERAEAQVREADAKAKSADRRAISAEKSMVEADEWIRQIHGAIVKGFSPRT